jgi:hypothetical protein
MRWPRPRFTIRSLMIAIAITALLLGAGIGVIGLVRRARHFRQIAANHANLEKLLLKILAQQEGIIAPKEQLADRLRSAIRDYDRLSRYFPSPPHEMSKSLLESTMQLIDSSRHFARFCRDLAAYAARMREKYERAASHPWETVPPDPPSPTMPPEPSDPPLPPAEPNPAPPEPERRTERRPLLTVAPGGTTVGRDPVLI